MTIELYTKVRLTVDFPEYGLHKGDTASRASVKEDLLRTRFI